MTKCSWSTFARTFLGGFDTPEHRRPSFDCATSSTARELRDHAIVAMLIGCELRRAELKALSVESNPAREERLVTADLVSKGGHVQTVPIPRCVKNAVDLIVSVVGACECDRVHRQCSAGGQRASQQDCTNQNHRRRQPHPDGSWLVMLRKTG
jgi:site-specific recombinase XerC